MLAEEIIGKPWGSEQNIRTNFVLMFACLFNADADCPLTFDALVEACDADLTLYQRMNEEMASQISRWGKPSDADEGDKKKD
jgi:hypothetical protein